ncbi:hypothetical protein [Microbacterium sp.]|uniref:hypothetical protein n=1 Tax=Microbacterium sp. TaxID=51671 RepID=UPI003A8C897E
MHELTPRTRRVLKLSNQGAGDEAGQSMAVSPAYSGAHEHARRELPDLEEFEAVLGIDFPDPPDVQLP